MLVNLLLVISRLASETYCVPSPMLGVGRGEAETLFFSDVLNHGNAFFGCTFIFLSSLHLADSPMGLLRGLL